jgi:hypothetical protein
MLYFLTGHHAIKAYWGSKQYISNHSLTSALDGGEWSVSRTGRLAPRERAPGTYWIGGWVGPRAVLDPVKRIPWLVKWQLASPEGPIHEVCQLIRSLTL